MSVRLRLRMARALHAVGEPIEIEVALRNDDAQPLAVYDPANRANPQWHFRITGGQAPIEIPASTAPDGPPITVQPVETLRAFVPIGRQAALPPGDYRLVARFTPDGGPAVDSEPIAFSVFAPQRREIVLPAARRPTLPESTTLTVAAIGTEAGLIVTHRLEPGLEHTGHYHVMRGQVRVIPPRPPCELIAVAAQPDDRLDWAVWTDEAGLVARAGDATVLGVRELPLKTPIVPVSPALQQTDGSLLVYAVQGDAHELVECRFAPPLTETQAPQGPDDWDDEIVVAGPAAVRRIGALDFDPVNGASCGAGGGARLVFTANGQAGITLWHAVIDDGPGPRASVLFEGARPLPDVRPVLTLDANGTSVARLLFWRPRMIENVAGQAIEDPDRLEVFLGTASFGGKRTAEPTVRCLGELPRPIRSAAMAVSWLEKELVYVRFAILDQEGTLHLGDGASGLKVVDVGAPIIVPLVLGTTAASAYLCTETPNGPLPFVILP